MSVGGQAVARWTRSTWVASPRGEVRGRGPTGQSSHHVNSSITEIYLTVVVFYIRLQQRPFIREMMHSALNLKSAVIALSAEG